MTRKKTVRGETLGVEGAKICWAGKCPWTESACFGTEEGDLFIPARDDDSPQSMIGVHAFGPGAINGVAFVGDYVAVSTPERVTVAQRVASDGRLNRVDRHDVGAHDVIALPSGVFLAPLGHDGLLAFPVGPSRFVKYSARAEGGTEFGFYRVSALHASVDGTYLALALRRDGLLAMQLSTELKPCGVLRHGFDGVDIVAASSLQSHEWPNSVVCIGRMGEMFFFRDATQPQQPDILEFAEMAGTVYSAHVAQGDLFVLTSKGLFAYPRLVHRFLRGDSIHVPTHVREMPVDAVCAAVCNDRLLLVVDDHVLAYSIDDLTTENPGRPGRAKVGRGEEWRSTRSSKFSPKAVPSPSRWSTKLDSHISRDLALA